MLNPVQGSRYLQISLHDADGRLRAKNVHVLVLEAFVGPRPQGYEACHGLGGRLDNSLSNLRWDTSSENRLDTTRHGNNRNANKVECNFGHELSGHNLMIRRRQRKDGSATETRECRECHNARRRVGGRVS